MSIRRPWRSLANALPAVFLAAALLPVPPAAAQPSAAGDLRAELAMKQAAEPYRRVADAFVAKAMAGDASATMAMLSRVMVGRTGEAAVRRVLEAQILPFFTQAREPGRSVTITQTTDAASQQGFAFYMWMEQAASAPARPFTLYVVEEQGRLVVANIVPDRLVEGRHR